MVKHRQQQIQTFYEFLDEQELPKPVRQCIFSGVTGWLSSTEEKPALTAPTKGKIMPAEQLATNAFVEQTRIGWDAFFRGYISLAWRRVILLASPTRDEEATETYLQRLLKRLHVLALEVWEFRNDVLHGATAEQRRAITRATVYDKVIVLYEEYNSGNLLLLARDRYLFLKKSKSERLASGTDTLLRWIRLVELAIKSYEGFHRQTQQYAERFFRSRGGRSYGRVFRLIWVKEYWTPYRKEESRLLLREPIVNARRINLVQKSLSTHSSY